MGMIRNFPGDVNNSAKQNKNQTDHFLLGRKIPDKTVQKMVDVGSRATFTGCTRLYKFLGKCF